MDKNLFKYFHFIFLLIQYNLGREKWRIMCKEEIEKARIIFLELVHNILSTFMPQILVKLTSLNVKRKLSLILVC